jgi:hypothetical protein
MKNFHHYQKNKTESHINVDKVVKYLQNFENELKDLLSIKINNNRVVRNKTGKLKLLD